MGWYKTADWTRRLPISVDNTAGSATADIDVTIPKGLDDFWSVIDASGNELRVVSSDSETDISYSIDNGSGGAFDLTNRKGRLRLDNVALPNVANSTVLLWLYYGSRTTQGSGATVGGTGGTSGYIDTSIPGLHRFPHSPQIPQQLRPRFTVHKRPSEEVYLFLDFQAALATRSLQGFERPFYEDYYYAVPSVVDTSGVAQAGMIDSARNRFTYAGQGRVLYKMLVQAGTTATSYTALADLRTRLPGISAVHQRLISSIGVHVRDVQW